MLVLLSPAKSINWNCKTDFYQNSVPELISNSERLVNALKKKSVKKIKDMMFLSDSLAQLNYERNQIWNPKHTTLNSKNPIVAFSGDVYRGFSFDTLDSSRYSFLNEHLYILSGLYGGLKPFDLIQPYRLEMGTKLKTTRGNTLYKFWGNRITNYINTRLDKLNSNLVINLASNEYFKSINVGKLNADVLSCEFKDFKNGEYKTVMTWAKLSRGRMARYIVENEITKKDELKGFDKEGYFFNDSLSSENVFVFTRN